MTRSDRDIERLLEKAGQQLASGAPLKAAGLYQKALDQRPGDLEVMTELARALETGDELLPACKLYDQIIQLGGGSADLWVATGRCLFELGEFAQSIDAFDRALALDRENAEATHSQARAYFRLGELDRAIRLLRRADQLTDGIGSFLSLASILPNAPGASQREILETRQQLGSRLAESQDPRQRPLRQGTGEPAKVGFLSSFFTSANYMKPVWAVLNELDRDRFEIHLLIDDPGDRKQLVGYKEFTSDKSHRTTGLDNAQLAHKIAELGIDLLVDLNAYASPERVGLFASPPAPIVAGWFNSYATSGMPGIDYIIGDENVVTRREEKFYSEKVVRLPLSYLTFTVAHDTPPVVERTPCSGGAPFTFGSLITQYKITPQVIAAWSKILRRSPGSRLLLANRALGSIENRNWLAARFEKHGIGADRLLLLPPADHLTYLRYYDRIDLALDGFPYNGGTTTMEAIWQGVPVLTFNGDRWASRTSQSILLQTHLAEFVAPNLRGMIKAAVRLANAPETPARLSEIRRHMRAELEQSSACDGAAAAREMAKLFDRLLDGEIPA